MIELRIIALVLLSLLSLNAFVLKWRWAAYVLGIMSTFFLMAPVAWNYYQSWPVSLSDNLLVTLVFVQSAYLTFFFAQKDAWKLGTFVQPILLVLAVISLCLWPGRSLIQLDSNWLFAHIIGALAAFGVLSYSAIVAAAYLYKSKKLKNHHHKKLTVLLPSINSLEKLEFSSLVMGQMFLLVSIIAGQWYYHMLSGHWLPHTHKFIFTLIAFVLVSVLILMRLIWGTRGRVASRIILTAFFLIFLGFIGSKFVLEFLI